MKDYTIAEYFTLPSKGLVYEQQVAPDVKLRAMTTIEEMKRLSPSEYAYKNMCDVLDDCIVGDIGISAYDLCIGDYQFLLHKLRVVTYGPEYNMSSLCPYCGKDNKMAIDLDNLPVINFDENILKYLEFDLPSTHKHIKIKFQTPRILDDIQIKVKELKTKLNNSSIDYSLVYTLVSIISEVDNKRLNSFELEEFVKKLPMMDVNTIITYAEKLNLSLGIETKLTNICELCGLGYTTQLKATSEFFRPSLDI